ncbi:MAG: J domain-containing protein [Spirochaetia bacterium]|nr:J domain-containing protein [Spirochaetia bacterium]
MNKNNIEEALDILDISGSFTELNIEKHIKKKYYEKAFELHPDKNGSKEDFQKLQVAYEYLCQLLKKNDGRLEKAIRKRIHKRNNKSGEGIEDFYLYKQAIHRYSDILEQYYEHVNQVNLNPEDPDYKLLCEQLKSLKTELFEIIRLKPGGIWISDCIEKIEKINIWLKAGNYTSR